MPAATEMARLKRDVNALIDAVNLDLRPGAKVMTPAQRRDLRSELETCMQALSELRNRLST